MAGAIERIFGSISGSKSGLPTRRIPSVVNLTFLYYRYRRVIHKRMMCVMRKASSLIESCL